MLMKADSKELVILCVNNTLFIGYIIYNSKLESFQYVIEKRDWFELEFPHYVTPKGLVKCPFNFLTIQRSSVNYYTIDIPYQFREEFQKFEDQLKEKFNEVAKSINQENEKIDNIKNSGKVIPLRRKDA